MALKSADSITSRIFQVNNIPYCNHVCRYEVYWYFLLLTCLHEVYWYIWPYFQNLRYIGMSTIVYEVNWMFPYLVLSIVVDLSIDLQLYRYAQAKAKAACA